MYWARAKNILIFTLLALNIFLAVNLYLYHSGRGASAEAEADADAILSSRNIEIACKIPRADIKATRLNFISDGYDRGMLANRLLGISAAQASDIDVGAVMQNGKKELKIRSAIAFSYTDGAPEASVDMSRAAKIESYAEDFLRDKGLLPSKYIVDETRQNEDHSVTLVFIEKYGDKLIFDNKLEVTVSSAGVTAITGRFRSVKKAEAVRQGTVMTARQVMLKNFTGTEKVAITGIDLGYKKSKSNENNIKSSTEEPVWRIKIKGEKLPRFFNIFNGIEINTD